MKRGQGGDQTAAYNYAKGYFKDYRMKYFLEMGDAQLQRGRGHRLCLERFRLEFGK